MLENGEISKYPEKDLVRILKDSAYHSEEWDETDSDDPDNVTEEPPNEKSKSIHIYEIWWRSSAVCTVYF